MRGEAIPAIYSGHDVGWQNHIQLNVAIKATSDAWRAAIVERRWAEEYLRTTKDGTTRVVMWNHLQDHLRPAVDEARWRHNRSHWALARFLLACHLEGAPMVPVV